MSYRCPEAGSMKNRRAWVHWSSWLAICCCSSICSCSMFAECSKRMPHSQMKAPLWWRRFLIWQTGHKTSFCCSSGSAYSVSRFFSPRAYHSLTSDSSSSRISSSSSTSFSSSLSSRRRISLSSDWKNGWFMMGLLWRFVCPTNWISRWASVHLLRVSMMRLRYFYRVFMCKYIGTLMGTHMSLPLAAFREVLAFGCPSAVFWPLLEHAAFALRRCDIPGFESSSFRFICICGYFVCF